MSINKYGAIWSCTASFLTNASATNVFSVYSANSPINVARFWLQKSQHVAVTTASSVVQCSLILSVKISLNQVSLCRKSKRTTDHIGNIFITCNYTSSSIEDSVVISMSVFLSVCTHISRTKHSNFAKFLCMLTVAAPRSSSGGIAIVVYFQFCGWHHLWTQWQEIGDAKTAHIQIFSPEMATSDRGRSLVPTIALLSCNWGLFSDRMPLTCCKCSGRVSQSVTDRWPELNSRQATWLDEERGKSQADIGGKWMDMLEQWTVMNFSFFIPRDAMLAR